ncbi:DUF5926 family protein [Corynebacterium pyruviciproducens]|uniref:DUF5926 family protein n=1 Tax=Corynebacterium pyruviciproducens TaxID=598660 RepID=UPI00254D6C2F|nr:DUF5926 family protein [Corynebacterium pyruviciproducens]MDK7214534.1 DUF5926 family protein [Corynebacterium pyruviciproducens]
MSKKKKKDQDLPEGMTRRQAKLAKRAAERAALEKDPRPYAGLDAETMLVALQEFVPSATAEIEVKGEKVTLATVLPGAVAALVRDTGERFVALQSRLRSHNPGRDLAYCLAWVVEAKPGAVLENATNDGSQPAIKDIFPAGELDVTEHQDFNWWLPENADAQSKQMIEQANNTIMPSYQVNADVAGTIFWVDAGDKAHIRWVRSDDEDTLLASLARAAAKDELNLGEGTKFAGVFRTHGILVPVFDLDPTVSHTEYDAELTRLNEFFAKDKDNSAPLTSEERHKMENIKSRQVTIR